jgi:potassium channel subfamily K
VHIKTQIHLEALPFKILQHAKTFHKHVQYFSGPGGRVSPGGGYGAAGAENGVDASGRGTSVPEWLHSLLDNIAGLERIGERIKQELLADHDLRNVRVLFCITNDYSENSLLDQMLFTLSIESLSMPR